VKHGVRRIVGLCVAAVLVTPVAAEEPLTLEQALRATRRNAPELGRPAAEAAAADAEAKGVAGAYDTEVYGGAEWVRDRSEQPSSFAGRYRDTRSLEAGVRKLFPSGTFIDGQYALERNFIAFSNQNQDDSPLAEIPGLPPEASAAIAQAFDPASFQQATAYDSRLRVIARQSLWRNLLGRELKLQRKIAETTGTPPRLERRLRAQLVQGEAEQLYWRLAGIRAQIDVAEELVSEAGRFVELMDRRRNFGRTEDIEVVAAESSRVAREGALLDLRLAERELARRLWLRIAPDAATRTVRLARPVSAAAIPLPATAPAKALALAREQRLDFALLAAQRKPLKLRKRLARERGKPEVALVGSLATSGLESDNGAGAFGDTFDDVDHLTFTVGLEATINLERTEARAQQAALDKRLAALDAEERALTRDLRETIETQFEALRAARARIRQAEREAAILAERRAAEAKRFAEARSDEVAVLNYDLERLNVEIRRLAALTELRQAQARLRLAMHAYPDVESD